MASLRACRHAPVTIPRVIDKPRPAPPVLLLRSRLGSNGATAMSDGKPTPSSADGDRYPSALSGLREHGDRRARRVVPDRVRQQVDEHLLEPVMVGPDHRQVRCAVDAHHAPAVWRQACRRRLEHQLDVAPVRLQPQDAKLDRGEVEQVVNKAAKPCRLGCDPGQEALLRLGVPGDVGLQQARGVTADRCQWRTQLVAEPGQEVALQFL